MIGPDADDRWKQAGVHWHAHQDPPTRRTSARWERRTLEPAAVLKTPEEVADWLLVEYQRLVRPVKVVILHQPEVYRLGDSVESAPHWADDFIAASRGDSITRTFPAISGGTYALHADAWTPQECAICQ